MKLEIVKKAWIVWNGADYKEPCYQAYPVEVFAETASKAKVAAGGEVTEELGTPEFTDYRARRDKNRDIVLFNGQEVSRDDVEYKVAYNEWYNRMTNFVTKNPNKEVYIYSGEHGMFWRSNSCGYTSERAAAGVYTATDAWNATSHCGLSKRINFIPVKID